MNADLRYPIGKWSGKAAVDNSERERFLKEVEVAPANLKAAVKGLSDQQLDTAYRDGGWTVRQVVHHVPDSHLNSYIRFKWALTEEQPVIKTYYEERWAELPDSKMPIQVSLTLLDSLHQRWSNLLRSFKPADWSKKLQHPELGPLTLDQLLSLYAWHGKHHVAHITALRDRMGW